MEINCSQQKMILVPLMLLFILIGDVGANLNIIDYQSKVSHKFSKKIRKRTDYIIVHTSEASLQSTLRTVCQGKFHCNRRYTNGGHANYVISRNGTVYRILDKTYRADHAGLSMWNGRQNISDISIGIELVAYHTGTISDKQYSSLSELLLILKKNFNVTDKNVLTHCQVAYGFPNKWFGTNHRGRKRCAMNFDRRRAGLTERWEYDPDVRAGRLQADPLLSSILYLDKPIHLGSNKISKVNTAWRIAGGDYDSYTTYYKLPNGDVIAGDKIDQTIGWDKIPTGTEVILNRENGTLLKDNGPIKIISDNNTAWSHAGRNYDSPSTYYIFPDGQLLSGDKMRDWDEIPTGTQMIINYRSPQALSSSQTPYSLIGQDFNKKEIVYLVPGNQFQTGDTIGNFQSLPQGTLLFRSY